MDESRAKAQEHVNEGKPLFKFMGPVIVGIWILAILLGRRGLDAAGLLA